MSKGTRVGLEQMDGSDGFQGESTVWTLETDVSGVQVLDDLDGGFVQALIPGYSVCILTRENILSEPHDLDPHPGRTGVVNLAIDVADEEGLLDGAARFFELAGAPLTSL